MHDSALATVTVIAMMGLFAAAYFLPLVIGWARRVPDPPDPAGNCGQAGNWDLAGRGQPR